MWSPRHDLNFFYMYVPIVPDGNMAIADGLSKPGGYIELEAEMDVLAVLSNCPRVYSPANAYCPTAIQILVLENTN
ncbi:DUF1989 domain-containing protein [Trinickia mobilis]|uniref:DUF1989 domain-containing protein n=1 Tax=Trinickia mobilis TaxID=2816356 RepID=UPI001A8EB6A4|nr:DUF1989 domain-containing protein [Trinickia mobilis]